MTKRVFLPLQISNFKFQTSTHLLISAVAAFSLGIVCSIKINLPPSFLVVLLFLPVFTLYFWQKNRVICRIFLTLFLFFTGLLHGAIQLQPPSHPSSLYQLFPTSQETTLVGTLLKSPAAGPQKTKFIMDVEAYLATSSSHSFQPARGKIQLSMKGRLDGNILPGDTLLVRAKVSPPNSYGIPASFDYQKFLARKSIWITGWVSSPAHIKKKKDTVKFPVLKSIRFLPENIRCKINFFLENNLAMPHSAFYKAILTGERTALAPQIIEDFKSSGTIHLLAISGLHMGLIAVVIGSLIRFLLSRSTWLLLHISAWKMAALLIIPIVCFYALIAGFQTPVVRSLIMTCVFLAALLFDRQSHISTNIAIAVFIILLFQPAAIFTVSFQLSFAAVISMSILMPYLLHQEDPPTSRKNKLSFSHTAMRYLKGALFISFAVQIGTLPLLLFYFNRLTPYSALATLSIEPFLCLWSLTIGIFAVPLLFIFPKFAVILFKIGSLGLTSAHFLSNWFASLPFNSIWLPTPTVVEIISYYVFLFILIQSIKRPYAWFFATGSCIALIFISFNGKLFVKQKDYDTISFLDVGQGNAAVIELAGGYTALIDGGGTFSERFNVGEMLIAPFLWRKKITHLEAIIISHPDADHFNGLPFIVEHFNPEKIWINGVMQQGNSYASLLNIARLKSDALLTPQAGEVLYKNETATIFNVTHLHKSTTTLSDNDKSLVIGLATRGIKFLFTGDISKNAEKLLAEDNKNIQADILQLPHHGSETSSGKEFLGRVSADYAIISAGKHKPNTFPSADVVNRCKEAGIELYNTARDGTITVTVTDQNVQIETWRNQRDL